MAAMAKRMARMGHGRRPELEYEMPVPGMPTDSRTPRLPTVMCAPRGPTETLAPRFETG
jgi:hypothetical protein